jgi:tetratricopeptide (TPR) repeat protein
VPTDREDSLKRAEKLLRQGRLEAAIAEYGVVVSDFPRDWNTANLLGDLYVRAGQVARACEQYTRVAEHLARDGFVAKAAALYKKVIKLSPGDEPALLRSAELAAEQGLTADVRAYMNTLFQIRIRRGDRDGAIAAARRRVALDPADVLGRLDAARMLADAGDVSGAAGELHHAGLALRDLGRLPEAVRALREAWRLEPDDQDTRVALIEVFLAQGDPAGAADYAVTAAEWRALASHCRKAGFEEAAWNALARLLEHEPDDAVARAELAARCLALGDLDGAATWATADVALTSPPLTVVLAEIYLRQGRLDEARTLLAEALSRDAHQEAAVSAVVLRLVDVDLDAATAALLPVIDALCDRGELERARGELEAFARTAAGAITALQRLIEVCVDGGFSAQLRDAQMWLADALLARQRWQEARSIAEDLVAGEPGNAGHAERLQRALRGLGLDDVVPVEVDVASPMQDAGFDGHDGLLSDDISDLVASLTAEASTSTLIPSASDGLERLDTPGASAAWPAFAGEFGLSRHPTPVDPLRPGAEVAMIDADLRRAFESDDGRVPKEASDGAFEVDLSLALDGLLADEPVTGGDVRHDDLDGYFQGLRDVAVMDARRDEAHRLLREGEVSYAAGQIDQAMLQLRTAAREPDVRFQASRLIARIARDRGRLGEAIEWLERAAEVPVSARETWQALLYELADTLEVAGERARALAVLLELRAATPGYRDVDSRVANLSSRQDEPGPTGRRRPE